MILSGLWLPCARNAFFFFLHVPKEILRPPYVPGLFLPTSKRNNMKWFFRATTFLAYVTSKRGAALYAPKIGWKKVREYTYEYFRMICVFDIMLRENNRTRFSKFLALIQMVFCCWTKVFPNIFCAWWKKEEKDVLPTAVRCLVSGCHKQNVWTLQF